MLNLTIEPSQATTKKERTKTVNITPNLHPTIITTDPRNKIATITKRVLRPPTTIMDMRWREWTDFVQIQLDLVNNSGHFLLIGRGICGEREAVRKQSEVRSMGQVPTIKIWQDLFFDPDWSGLWPLRKPNMWNTFFVKGGLTAALKEPKEWLRERMHAIFFTIHFFLFFFSVNSPDVISIEAKRTTTTATTITTDKSCPKLEVSASKTWTRK